MTTGIWYQDVLAAIGAPDTPTNEAALQAWANAEGTPPQDYNWLATTEKGSAFPTSGTIAPNGGDDVPAYANYGVGVQATATNILQYPAIVAALQAGNSYTDIYNAINASGWCKGCQNGYYPSALATLVSNPQKQGSTTSGTTSATGVGAQEGPRWLGLLNPSRCVVSAPLLGCFITALDARKIKGYSVMVVGGFGVLVGVGLVFGIGLAKSPVGGVVKGLTGYQSKAKKTAARPAGKKSAPSRPSLPSSDAKELADRRVEDDQRRRTQASDAQERQEGFSKAKRDPNLPTPASRRAANRQAAASRGSGRRTKTAA